MDNDSAMAALWHHDQEAAYIAHEAARVAAMCAAAGGHPENREALERILLLAAHIDTPAPRNTAQQELFAA